jgi:hypothetical protein
MNYDIHDINEWAEYLAYHQLNEVKQAAVLAEMSIEEYDELHQTVNVFTGFLQDEAQGLEPRKESLVALQQEAEENKKPVSIFAIRIPAYQAVAACFLIAIGSYFLFGKTETNTVVVEKEVPVYELVRDTIFREVPVIEYVTKTVIRNVPAIEKTSIAVSTYVPQADYALRQAAETPSMNDVSKSFGNTAVSADRLEQFKVRM